MEVAYELRGLLDLLVGIQPEESETGGQLPHWPYARLLQRWQEIVATPMEDVAPRMAVSGRSSGTACLRRKRSPSSETYYGSTEQKDSPVTVSAINLEALVPVAQALDTFSVVFLQWLSNEVVWRARERVVMESHGCPDTVAELRPRRSWPRQSRTALYDAADEALVRWAAEAIPVIPYPSLSRTLRVMGSTAREPRDCRRARRCLPRLADELAACRSRLERLLAVAVDQTSERRCPITRTWTRAFARCSRIPPSQTACASPRPGRRLSSAPAIASLAPQARELDRRVRRH